MNTHSMTKTHDNHMTNTHDKHMTNTNYDKPMTKEASKMAPNGQIQNGGHTAFDNYSLGKKNLFMI